MPGDPGGPRSPQRILRCDSAMSLLRLRREISSSAKLIFQGDPLVTFTHALDAIFRLLSARQQAADLVVAFRRRDPRIGQKTNNLPDPIDVLEVCRCIHWRPRLGRWRSVRRDAFGG